MKENTAARIIFYTGLLATLGIGITSFSFGKRDRTNESKNEYEVTGIRSCEVEGKNYVILDRKFGTDIYIRQDDDSYVRLSEMIDKQRQDAQLEFDKDKTGLIKKINDAAVPKIESELWNNYNPPIKAEREEGK